MRASLQMISCVTSVALGGCATVTMTAVQPEHLPALAESTVRHPDGWHDTIDAAGRPVTLKGPIESVGVLHSGRGQGEDSFQAPFMARVEGGYLALRDARHASSYPLWDIHRITVRANEPARSTAGGVAMILGGTIPLASAMYVFVNMAGSQDPSGQNLARALLPLGLISLMGSVALIAPGIVLIVKDQKGDPRKSERPTAALGLVPGGAPIPHQPR